MSDIPNAQLLRSLGHLVRGLSALFWGLPVALIICVQTTRTDVLRVFGFIPPVFVTGWLLFGLWELGHFQKQERVWHGTLSRAKLLALVNVGLSPFLFWWSQVPAEPLFIRMLLLLLLTAVLFLSELNLVLRRLVAMLPDESLRADTLEFTAINRVLLLATLLLVAVDFALSRVPKLPSWLAFGLEFVEQRGAWLMILLVLLPLAMTMALLWKTKSAILDSIFGAKN